MTSSKKLYYFLFNVRNLNVKQKLVLILAFPLCAFLLLFGDKTYVAFNELNKYREAIDYIYFADQLTQLTNEVDEERNYALYPELSAQWVIQTKKVNARIDEIKKYILENNIHDLHENEVYDFINNKSKLLSMLEAIRTQPATSISYRHIKYSVVNEQILHLAAHVIFEKLIKENMTELPLIYMYLFQLREKMASVIELTNYRGKRSHVSQQEGQYFAELAKEASFDMYSQLKSLIAALEVYEDQEPHGDIEKIAIMQELKKVKFFFAKDLMLADNNLGIKNKIDFIDSAKKDMVKLIHDRYDVMLKRARTSLAFFVVLFLIFMTFVVLLVYYTSKSIIDPLYQAKSMLEEIGRGNGYLKIENNYKNEFGQLLGCIQKMGHQISDSKSALYEQKRLLDASSIVSYTDKDGRITYVNDKFCEISKYTKEELLGKNHRLLSSGFHPPHFWKDMWNTIQDGKIWTGIVKNKAKDGTYYWVYSVMMPRYDYKFEIVGYMSSRVDITEQKNNEAQLYHTAKLASIGELAASVGHEINNPLTIAIGQVNKIVKEIHHLEIKNQIIENSYDKFFQATYRIKNIVDGLRSFSRIDSNGEAEVINLTTIIDQTLLLISDMLEEQDIDIQYVASNMNLYVKGSRGPIQQVVMNLVLNAKDATFGLSERKIIINEIENNRQVGFSIADNGTGISVEIKDKIFDKYFTTKADGKGTGLGLSIVKQIVQKYKGEIFFQTSEGKGTIFTVLFPKAQPMLAVEEEKLKNQPQQFSGKALVVDDEIDLCELLKDDLEDLGLEVDFSSDVDKAKEMMNLKKYDYLFFDLRMPKMSGTELVVVADKILGEYPAIFILTGGEVKESLDIDTKNRISKIIYKPYSIEDLKKCLSLATERFKKAS